MKARKAELAEQKNKLVKELGEKKNALALLRQVGVSWGRCYLVECLTVDIHQKLRDVQQDYQAAEQQRRSLEQEVCSCPGQQCSVVVV